jgi:V8-like Glu-specific endopeptidase
MKTTLVIALSAIVSFNTFASEKVIYGKDNRQDLYEVTNPLYKTLADSTVVLVQRSDVRQNSSGVLEVNASSFQDTMGVCSNERFADQPSGGFCSGSLIGKNLMLTAGHCITSASSCASTQFVFNYAVNAKGVYPREVSEANVVGCKEIVYRVQEGSGADFAIIKLDRDVTNHAPLKLASRKDKIAKSTELLMIGSPAGLPTKVEDGATVRSNDPKGYFVANTDSYGGNSGSAVFNRKTGEIEGVLVRGETDYVYRNGCYVSNVVADNAGRGEDITDVSFVAAKMPASRKN